MLPYSVCGPVSCSEWLPDAVLWLGCGREVLEQSEWPPTTYRGRHLEDARLRDFQHWRHLRSGREGGGAGGINADLGGDSHGTLLQLTNRQAALPVKVQQGVYLVNMVRMRAAAATHTNRAWY